jgi:RNA recognition motif-containing protein
MGRRLYVGNLSYSVSSPELEHLFSEHGTVRSAEVVSDRTTGQSRGFGFVEMGSDEGAQVAVDGLNGQPYGGRTLTVNEAKPREQRGGGRGHGGNRY